MVQLTSYVRTKEESRVSVDRQRASYVRKLFFSKSSVRIFVNGIEFFDTLYRSDKQSHKILIERFIDDLLIYGILQTGH